MNVSPTVTYDTNSAWMPPATPASAHEIANAIILQRNVGTPMHFGDVLVVVDREQPGAEPRRVESSAR